MNRTGPGAPDSNPRPRPDAISLVGLLLLCLVLALIAVSTLGSSAAEEIASVSETPSSAQSTQASPAATRPAHTATPAPLEPTAGPTETQMVPTATAAPPTATATSPPTATATAAATAAATPSPAPTTAALAQPSGPAPLPTPVGAYSWTLPVPILMYHYLSAPPEGADKYRLDLSVSPEDFRAQMRYLVENGFETISLADLSLAIVDKRELPARPIVVSFDDGYRDNYENAFPILQEMGLKATFFVATDFVDRGDPNYMTWEMIAEMAAAGMDFQPHSKTHPDLRNRDRDFLIWEIQGSRETLEARLGRTIRYFAYPGGQYDEAVVNVLRELGFWGAVTTAHGQWHGFKDRFEWSRVRIRNTTSLPEFAGMIDVAGRSPRS